MPCPTCDHTMHLLSAPTAQAAIRKDWWCPRCGTLVTEQPNGLVVHRDVAVPKLVDRCRQFAAGGLDEDAWYGLGIAESINLPHQRT